MADGDSGKGGKPKLDASDLKARLGLKKKAAAPVAPFVPPAPTKPAETPAAPEPPSEESIAEARRKAEQAAREAGPALEDFSVVGQEHTPLPSALPGTRVEYVSVGADETYPGKERARRLLLVGVAVTVGIVAFFLGQLVSGASLQNELRESYILEAREKARFLDNHNAVLDRIDKLRDTTRRVLGQVRGVEDAEPAALQAALAPFIEELKAYRSDKIYIDPGAMMGNTLYNGELMRDAVDLAVRTRLIYDRINVGLTEVTTYAQMSEPPPTTTRGLMVERGEREIAELGTVPTGQGVWLADTGRPSEIELRDPAGRVVGTDWQMLVLPVGSEEPVQVPTTQVLQLDLGWVYEERAKSAASIATARVIALAQELEGMLSGVRHQPLRERVLEWARKE